MTDQERIEKLLMTLKHLDNCMMYLRNMAISEEVKGAIDDIKSTINTVLEANSDQIKLDL